jgi:hypothetical protein
LFSGPAPLRGLLGSRYFDGTSSSVISKNFRHALPSCVTSPELFAQVKARGGRLVRRGGVISVEAVSITPEMVASVKAHQSDLLLLVPEPKPKTPEPEPTSEEPTDPEFLAELDALDPEEDSGLDEAIRKWREEQDAKQLTP